MPPNPSSATSGKRFFFLHHEDLYAGQLTMARVVKSILGEHFDPKINPTSHSEVSTFYASSKDSTEEDRFSLSHLFEQASMPLISTGVSIVVVWDYDQIKNKNAVEHLVRHAFPSCFLIFVKRGIEFGSKPLQRFASARSDVEVVQHRKPKRPQLQKRIRDLLARHDLVASPSAVELLLEANSSFPDNLPQEIDKVATFFADQKRKEPIDASEIAPLIFEDKEIKVFDFVGEFLLAPPSQVLQSFLDFLNSSGDLIPLQSLLSMEVRRVIQYKELQKKQVPESRIFPELNVHYPARMRQLRQQASRRSLAEYYLLLELILELERILKTESLMGVSIDRGKLNHQAKHFLEKVVVGHL